MIIHDNNKNGIRNFQNQNLQENALIQKVTNRVPVSQPSPNGIPVVKSVQHRVIFVGKLKAKPRNLVLSTELIT